MTIYEEWIELYRLIRQNSPNGIDPTIEDLLTELNQLILLTVVCLSEQKQSVVTISTEDSLTNDKQISISNGNRAHNSTNLAEIIVRLEKLNRYLYECDLIQNKLKIQEVLEKFYARFTRKTLSYLFSKFAGFPADMLLKIFIHLSPEDLVAIARVIRRFQNLANTPSLWENLYRSSRHGLITKITFTWKKSFSDWYSHTYKNVSSSTRRLFSLVLNNDLDGLKANERLITEASLREENSDGKTYLKIAKEKKYKEIVTFILTTLKNKAANQYLKLKYTVALDESVEKNFPNLDTNNRLLAKLFVDVFFKTHGARFIPKENLDDLLKITIGNNDLKATEELIEQGADVCQAIIIAYNCYNIKLVTSLISSRRPDICDVIKSAIKAQNISLLEYLISLLNSNHPEVYRHQYFAEWLLISATTGSAEIVRLLTSAALERQVPIPKNMLHRALSKPNNAEVIGYLLENKERYKLDLSHKENERTPLSHAIETDFRYVKLLINAGAEFSATVTSLGESYSSLTDLKYLARNPHADQIQVILNYFITNFKISILNLRTEEGYTLLHEAVAHGNETLVSALLELTYHVNDNLNVNRETPLHVHFSHHYGATNMNTFRNLAKASPCITLADSQGESVIEMIGKLTNNSEKITAYLTILAENRCLDPKHLRSKNAFVSAVQNLGFQAEDALGTYIKLGFDVNAKDALDRTPLYVAVKDSQNIIKVRRLVLNGADPNLPSVDGISPLQLCEREEKNNPFYRRVLQVFQTDHHFKNCISALKKHAFFALFSENFATHLTQAAKTNIEFMRELFKKELKANNLSREQKMQMVMYAEQKIPNLYLQDEIQEFKQGAGKASVPELK